MKFLSILRFIQLVYVRMYSVYYGAGSAHFIHDLVGPLTKFFTASRCISARYWHHRLDALRITDY